MRYEIFVICKGDHGSTVYPVKSLHEVNTWLKTCIDDTVQSVDVRDTITKKSVTYTGTLISKASFTA